VRAWLPEHLPVIEEVNWQVQHLTPTLPSSNLRPNGQEGLRWTLTKDGSPDEVTHGICRECYAVETKPLDEKLGSYRVLLPLTVKVAGDE